MMRQDFSVSCRKLARVGLNPQSCAYGAHALTTELYCRTMRNS